MEIQKRIRQTTRNYPKSYSRSHVDNATGSEWLHFLRNIKASEGGEMQNLWSCRRPSLAKRTIINSSMICLGTLCDALCKVKSSSFVLLLAWVFLAISLAPDHAIDMKTMDQLLQI
eukprot:4170905-Amphidinium_carterae.1